MGWISSLFDVCCPFCRAPGRDSRRAAGFCDSCAKQAALWESTPPDWKTLPRLPVLFRVPYDGRFRDFLLLQKASPDPQAVRWAAAWLLRGVPFDWRSARWYWVPGSPFRGAHFIECLALELGRLGVPVSARPMLRRNLLAGRSQKSLGGIERAGRKRFRSSRRPKSGNAGPFPGRRGILLDDVLTTGSTLQACAELLRSEGVQVLGGVVLAHTPLKKPGSQQASGA